MMVPRLASIGRQAAEQAAAGLGSAGASGVGPLRGPAGTPSALTSRRPFGPCTVTTAPAAIIAGTLSPAGEPLQRLPPAEARPRPCLETIRLIAPGRPGP